MSEATIVEETRAKGTRGPMHLKKCLRYHGYRFYVCIKLLEPLEAP